MIRPGSNQVLQGMAVAAEVHVESVLTEGGLWDGRPLLQLQQIFPRVPLAMRDDHESQLQIIHTQCSPACNLHGSNEGPKVGCMGNDGWKACHVVNMLARNLTVNFPKEDRASRLPCVDTCWSCR